MTYEHTFVINIQVYAMLMFLPVNQLIVLWFWAYKCEIFISSLFFDENR